MFLESPRENKQNEKWHSVIIIIHQSTGRQRRSQKKTQLYLLNFLHLYTPYATGPHNKASLCCTTLQVAQIFPTADFHRFEKMKT